MNGKQKTTVGVVSDEVLAFTAGTDVVLDRAIIDADCIGSAAHVTMLSRMPLTPRLFTPSQRKKVIAELVAIMKRAARNQFIITLADQDVHLAVERSLTERLGDLGKKVHTGRSRNDQVAVDLRLYGKQQLLDALEETTALALALVAFAREHEGVPMVGRTHMQPAMPSSVGLWASSFAEELMDDVSLLEAAYDLNDACPLGSAASYGVPLPIDRQLVSDLLGFSRPAHNVLFANNSRGRIESVILSAMAQVMLTLSRLAQDLMLFTMPEFSYFGLPAEFCTGSSIMPQKRNPDVLELVRAKAARVQACASMVYDLVKNLPTGYNRDLQEAKEPFMAGIAATRASVRIMTPLIAAMKVNEPRLLTAFTPDVFATDRAVELVGEGVPFRDAYHYVKANLHELGRVDPREAIAKKTHLGGTAGLDLAGMEKAVRKHDDGVRRRRSEWHKAIARLLGTRYPVS